MGEREDYDDRLPPPWWFSILRPSDYLLILVVALALPLLGVAVMWAIGR
jgi:hypothetical protein